MAKTSEHLSELDVHPAIAAALERGLAAEFGHNATETQNQARRCARKLVLCLQKLGAHASIPMPACVAADVHTWLKRSGLKGSTAQSQQAIILVLLRWCHRNTPRVISRRATFVVPSFHRDPPTARRKLAADEVKVVLAACYREIEVTETRLARGHRVTSGKPLDAVESEFARTVADLLNVGDGVIPTQRVVNRSGLALARRSSEAGGLRHIREELSLTHSAVFPFYLAILVQAAANPHALRDAEKNCIRKHPLRADLEFLDWDKGRSASEQRNDFPIDKIWSAPNLVRRLCVLNESLRKHARAEDRDKLFLSQGTQFAAPTVPSVQTLHNTLAAFIERNGLRDFDFKDCRPSSARAHHIAAGTIEASRKKLNHKDAATTRRGYTSDEDVAGPNDRAIACYQGTLADLDTAPPKPVGEPAHTDDFRPAPTIFGFVCRNPYAGLDNRTPRGTLCVNFTKCSGCRGALVPVDDIEVVSRILGAKLALSKARKRAMEDGWWNRFKALYEPTERAIDQEVLPYVHKSVLEAARQNVKPHYVPFLE